MVRFTTKKIDSLTLGEQMKKIREDRRLSVNEISRNTKIQVKYLGYLERGQYALLPAEVYVRGFLRSYASYMGLNEDTLLKQYEREKGIQKNMKKLKIDEGPKKPIDFSSFVLTPKMVVVGGILVFSMLIMAYLYRQVNTFVSIPRLIIIKPLDNSTIESSSTKVAGLSEKDALVYINGQQILVNENGEFSEDIGLKNGVNVITIRAVRSKFNKESSKTITINANFQNQVSMDDAENASQNSKTTSDKNTNEDKKPVVVEIMVKPSQTWITVEADGNSVYSGVLLPESAQTFSANDSIVITSGKGNETYVKINGKDMGTLGSDSGVVRNVEFNSEGRVEK